MDEVSKELIKRTKEIIDSGLKNYPDYYDRKDFIYSIRMERRFLNHIIQFIQHSFYFYKSRLAQETKFRAYINNESCFNIIGVDVGEDSSTIDISSRFADLEVIYTVIINNDDMYLTNDMAIRLLNDPDNEVWLYESELSELYK